MSVLVLDAVAFSRLARPGRDRDRLRALLRGAWLEKIEICVPAAVLAELYRGGSHDQVVDSYLGRESAVLVVPTTRALARTVGHVLAQAGRGSADHVDATVVAVAVSGGGGVIATGDPDDLTDLSSAAVGVVVLPI